jgi:tetratricopeptide (TPR) repeat protein/class 3 adenylate cyclase
LFSLLLPPALQDALCQLPADLPLIIATDDTELPWELLHNGTQYLALKHPVGRRFLSSTPARQNPISDRIRRSFLFITNPTEDLPQTDIEVERLMDAFDTAPEVIDARFLCRVQASRLEVLQALASGQYNVIHYSGHARPGALLLADGELTADDIQKALRGRPFIFLNACWSTEEPRSTGAREHGSMGESYPAPGLPYAGLTARSLTSAFILGGAIGFIGTLWPVFDVSSREFAEWFYALVLDGIPVGEALRRTQERMYRTRPGDPLWASFVLYGDPTLRIAGLERRQTRPVTVLVARLSGLLPLFDALGLEAAAEIENQVLDRLSQIARRYGGEPRGPLTDILGVRFGVPDAREDDAERAIRTALEMAHSLGKFNESLADRWGEMPSRPTLGLRLGISTGRVVGRQLITAEGSDYQITGDVVDRAAGLARHAGEGHVLVDETTRRLTQAAFTFEPKGSLTITEGIRPIAAHRVLGAKEALPPPIPMVGRERELTRLQGWWHEATAGHGRLVAVTGAAGVGKTRLVQAFREWLSDQEHRWITATCESYDQNTPYALLAQVISGLADTIPVDDEATRRSKLEVLVRGVVCGEGPRVAEQINEGLALLGQVVGLRIPASAVETLEPELRQKKLASVIQAVLAHQSAQQPLVLVLEDLHWADEASLRVLDQIASAVGRMHALLLAVHRPEAVDRADWPREWSKLGHYGHLSLRELDEGARCALLASLLGVERAPEALSQAILSRTGGNPFFVAEVVKSLQESGTLTRLGDAWVLEGEPDQVPLPDRVENVILARLDQLAEPGREVLQKASVIGQEFEYRVLKGVQDEAAREELDRNLGDLTRRHFIFELGGWWPDVNYTFSHGLIHQTIYTHLLERFRRTVHRLVAQVLRRLYAEEEIVERLAQHYDHSDDRVNAIRYCLWAARRAADAWANATALSWYDRVLAKIRSFDETPPTEAEQEQGATPTQILQWHAEALEGQAEVQSAIGHNDEAIAGYAEALGLATDSEVFPATRRAGLYCKMAIAHQNKGEFEAAQKALNRGLDALGGLVCLEAGRLHVWTGLIHYRRGRLQQGLASCERGITIIEQTDNLQDLAQAYNLQGLVLHELGRSQEAITAHERSIALYEEVGYLPGKERAYSNQGCVYQDLGRWDEALRYFQEAAELSDRTGEEWRRAAAAINLGEIYRRQGELDQAIAAYERAREISETFGFGELVGLALMNLGASYLKRGQFVEARGRLEEALDAFQRIGADRHLPEVLRYLAELHVLRGQPDEALGLAQEALDRALQLGHPLEASHARRVLGRVHRALGQLEAADAQLAQSLAIFEEQNSPYEMGLTLLELALLRKAQADAAENGEALREQASVYCDRATAIFAELGARLDLELAQEVCTLL